jgi:hypothetical protein
LQAVYVLAVLLRLACNHEEGMQIRDGVYLSTAQRIDRWLELALRTALVRRPLENASQQIVITGDRSSG